MAPLTAAPLRCIGSRPTTEQGSPKFKATGAAPIFPTTDLPGAVERYRRMGFLVHAYPDDTGRDEAIYAFACYGPGELHLSRVACTIPQANTASAYVGSVLKSP